MDSRTPAQRRVQLVLLTEAAAAVALSLVLGNVRLLELPNGGSIALATVPLLALASVRGVRVGACTGAAAGIAHALNGGTIVHPAQLGLDYVGAYAALGVAGVASRGIASRLRLAGPILLAMALHLTAMVVSGAIFFAPSGSGAVAYALAYNAATVLPEAALALWLVPGVAVALARANPADAWRRGLLAPPNTARRVPRFPAAPVTHILADPQPDRAGRHPSPFRRPAPFLPSARRSG